MPEALEGLTMASQTHLQLLSLAIQSPSHRNPVGILRLLSPHSSGTNYMLQTIQDLFYTVPSNQDQVIQEAFKSTNSYHAPAIGHEEYHRTMDFASI